MPLELVCTPVLLCKNNINSCKSSAFRNKVSLINHTTTTSNFNIYARHLPLSSQLAQLLI